MLFVLGFYHTPYVKNNVSRRQTEKPCFCNKHVSATNMFLQQKCFCNKNVSEAAKKNFASWEANFVSTRFPRQAREAFEKNTM